MSQNPYVPQDPHRSGSYEDYSQGYTQPPQAPAYGQTPFQAPSYAQAPPDPYAQPTYSDPTYGQPPYTQTGYGQGYQATPSYGLAPYAAMDANPRPSVTLPQAVKLWLKNWKNFTGRASRSEFWWAYLALFLVYMVLTVVLMIVFFGIAAASGGSDSAFAAAFAGMYGLIGLAGLASFVPTLAMSIRRLHDTNQSGWLYLITLVPYIGGIVLIVLLAQPSNPAGARFDDRAQPLFGPENL